MPDVMDLFPHLKDLETIQLHARREELKGFASRDSRPHTDDELRELVCIMRLLRTRASMTTKSGRAPGEGGGSTRKVVPTAEML